MVGDKMTSILEESTTLPVEHARVINLKPYEKWPVPYTGSRYSVIERRVNGKRRMLCIWQYKDFEPVYTCDNKYNPILPKGLLNAFRNVGKSKGSFRVTANKEVITKVKEDDSWTPYYLGRLNGEWNFPKLNLDPEKEMYDVWDGLSFNHGQQWSVWVRERAGNYLYWSISKGYSNSYPKKKRSLTFRSIEEYPELVETYREIRPTGGRLYINEFGHIWMNLKSSQVSSIYESDIKSSIQEWNKNDSSNKKIVNKRLRYTDGCWPIYLGSIEEYDHGSPPRKYFEDLTPYLIDYKGFNK